MNKTESTSHLDLLNQTVEALKSATTDQYGRLRPYSDIKYFDISVTKSSLQRALKLFEALITALEKEGYSLLIVKNPLPYVYSRPWITKVKTPDYEIPIRLEEATHKKKRELTKKELQQSYIYNQYTYTPTMKLTLVIDYFTGETTKRWGDSKNILVEERLPSFINALNMTALAGKKHSIEMREKHQVWEQLEKIKQQDNLRVQKLEGLLKSWQISRDISSLAQHLESGITNDNLSIENKRSIQLWVEWMKKRAQTLDPKEQIISIPFETIPLKSSSNEQENSF